MQTKIRPMTPNDHVKDVAKLLIQVDPELFQILFPTNTINTLTNLIAQDAGNFSYRHITLIESEGHIAGAIQHFVMNHVTTWQYIRGYIGALGLRESLRVLNRARKHHILQLILSGKERTGRYIQAITVDTAYRGKGLGAALIQWVIDDAYEKGDPQVVLEADQSKTALISYYQELGFQPIDEPSITFSALPTKIALARPTRLH